ncbi:hypothetical protein EIN_020670 [Entamoeba invadens IP1]|uniref:hypothetical protein n=1 Tax=Entamoeba invadens IP1 TaxID=370355 RepID=UPI0002C3EAAF|nr:hypothetical protein EIN_020670 [Entamoeba invadens IP1]ELP90588.1 hypothetical protein EIN_020670 [Entamoeba invadens IP1]|eukprot:XP_004257359.1 hypothetical protein EIN_020670 [Entamoeba invadens IP1]
MMKHNLQQLTMNEIVFNTPKEKYGKDDSITIREMQRYILILEKIITKKNTTIISMEKRLEEYKPFNEFVNSTDPILYASPVMDMLCELISDRDEETKNKILKRWSDHLSNEMITVKKLVKKRKDSFDPLRSKLKYIDLKTDIEREDSKEFVMLQPLGSEVGFIRSDKKTLPNQQPNVQLYECLLKNFLYEEGIYYTKFEILTKYFITPLRNAQLAFESVKVLSDVLPPIMSLERRLNRALKAPEANVMKVFKDYVQEIDVYIPYIIILKNTKLRQDILENCANKTFKKEQAELVNQSLFVNPDQILPATTYLDAPSFRFSKLSKIFGDLLSNVDMKHPDFSSLTAIYTLVLKTMKKYEQQLRLTESKKSLDDLQKLFPTDNIIEKDRVLLHYGALNVLEDKSSWCMGFLFTDIFILARSTIHNVAGTSKEALLRFENVPSGKDVLSLQYYRFTEILRFTTNTSHFKQVCENVLAPNAFFVQQDDIKAHCSCPSLKELQAWVLNLLKLKK